jgi:probable HAF family extracellular repeat protein
MQDINTLGANASTAYGINNQGQVVGAFHTLATQWQAFLYSNGLMQDLNSLVDPNWAGTLTAAYDINESGQIITNGYYEFGETHAFVLTPVFPPPNLYLLSPNGVETYHVGTSETITWESEGEVYNVQLSYSSDNGSTWNTINAVANTGNTTWTIPNAPSSECILKISDADDPNIFDTSDDVFTIQHRCYEQITGDLDGDCIVGLSDFAIIANNWMNQGKVFVRAFPLDESPNWTAEGQWEFGHPLGLGGVSYGYPDPSSGYTGQNVYGVNLAGDYNTEIGGPYYLATEPIGCTRYDNMKVSFMSWLNIDSSDYVRCRFEVSANGTDWVVLWNNNFEPITDENWSKMEFDISEYADDNPSLYLRWKYEVIENRAYPYSGWNIDDIELWGTL